MDAQKENSEKPKSNKSNNRLESLAAVFLRDKNICGGLKLLYRTVFSV